MIERSGLGFLGLSFSFGPRAFEVVSSFVAVVMVAIAEESQGLEEKVLSAL